MLSVLVLSALAASPGHGSAVTGPAGCGRHCSGHCTPGLGAVGPALSSANDVPSACACLRLCADDPVAQAWQWVSKKGEHNYRTCYLKGTVDLQPNPVYVSGCMPKGRANATARCPARPPAPPVPPVPPVPPGTAFPASRLITAAQGAQLNSWAKQAVGQTWKICYTSFTMDKSSPAEFHKRCDGRGYNKTVTVAHNSGGIFPGRCFGRCTVTDGPSHGVCAKIGQPCDGGVCKGECEVQEHRSTPCGRIGKGCGTPNPGNLTFGGFADGAWRSGIDPSPFGTAASFIFSLGPGEPKRFPSTGNNAIYLSSGWNYWPTWGAHGNFGDLTMGYNGPVGANGYCNQGHTYAGGASICGGNSQRGSPWGKTDLEVWRLVEVAPPGVVCDTKWADPRSKHDVSPLVLSCPGGRTLSMVLFADYGLSVSINTCSFTANPACSSDQSANVTRACVGKSSCSIKVGRPFFGTTDPCRGNNQKHLSVSATCSEHVDTNTELSIHSGIEA